MEKPSSAEKEKQIGQAESTRMITSEFVNTVVWAFLLVLFVCGIVFFLQVHVLKKYKIQEIAEASRIHAESIDDGLYFYEHVMKMVQINLDGRQSFAGVSSQATIFKQESEPAKRIKILRVAMRKNGNANEKNMFAALNAFAFTNNNLRNLNDGILQSYLVLDNGMIAVMPVDYRGEIGDLSDYFDIQLNFFRGDGSGEEKKRWVGIHTIAKTGKTYLLMSVPLYAQGKLIGLTSCDIDVSKIFNRGRLSGVFSGRAIMVSLQGGGVLADSDMKYAVQNKLYILDDILPEALEIQNQGIMLQPEGYPVPYAGYTVISRTIAGTTVKLLYVVENRSILESALNGVVFYLFILFLLIVVVIVMIRMIVKSIVKPAITLVEHISTGSNEVSDSVLASVSEPWKQLFYQTAKSFSIQSIADKMPGAIISFETKELNESSIIFISSGVSTHFGLDPDEMKKGYLSRYIKDIYYVSLKNAMINAINNQNNLFFDMEISNGKSGWHWARLIVTPRQRSDATVLWDGVLLDISEQKHAEELFAAIFQNHNVIMLLVDVDTLQVIDANISAKIFYGEDIIGKNISRLIGQSSDIKIKDLFSHAVGASVIYRGTAVNQNGEKRIINSDITVVEQDMKKVAFVITYDVTEKMILEEALQNARQEAENNLELILALFAAIPNPVLFLDNQGLITGCNPAYEHFFGKNSTTLVGHEPEMELNLPSLGDDAACIKSEDDMSGLTVYECSLLNAWHQERFFEIHSSVTRDRDNKPSGMVIVMVDITERKHKEFDLKLRATTDMLTGINNRANFMELAEAEVVRAHRYGIPMSVLYIDIDYFKHINDEHGHFAGDVVLAEIATVCENTLRQGDFIGRIGGEEFAACLVQCTIEDAFFAAERIRKNIADRKFLVGSKEISITLSVGAAQLQDNEGLEEVIIRSDAALYEAKKNGRNKVIADALTTR